MDNEDVAIADMMKKYSWRSASLILALATLLGGYIISNPVKFGLCHAAYQNGLGLSCVGPYLYQNIGDFLLIFGFYLLVSAVFLIVVGRDVIVKAWLAAVALLLVFGSAFVYESSSGGIAFGLGYLILFITIIASALHTCDSRRKEGKSISFVIILAVIFLAVAILSLMALSQPINIGNI